MAGSNKFKKKEQLCWECKNACGGCDWSRKLLPVKGGEAEETTVGMTVYEEGRKIYKQVKSFKIKSCPKFIKE